MNYRVIQPTAALAHLVRSFWILEGSGPYSHFSLPDVCPELIFHFKGRFDEPSQNGEKIPSFTAGLHAQTANTKSFHTKDDFGILGAYLYPHAIPVLFDNPANEVTGQMIDIDTLAGADGRTAEDAIANAADNESRIRLLETFIEKRLSEKEEATLPVFQSIQLIIEKRGLVRIADLSSPACLSSRQFIRQFTRYAGFAPKLFSRIVRFQAATEFYGSSPTPLAEVAYACGYYDQTHFAKDFREFSGMPPKNYFSGKSAVTVWKDANQK